jgi:hypothetical protein
VPIFYFITTLWHFAYLVSVRKYPYFMSFRQSSGRNLLKISNGFPLTACGNDKFGQTLFNPDIPMAAEAILLPLMFCFHLVDAAIDPTINSITPISS